MDGSTLSLPDQATNIRPSGRNRRLRGWQLTALVALLLVGLAVVAESRGGSLDPTDPANYNTFVLRNDLSHGVRVQSCRDRTCMAFYGDGQTVVPGGRDPRGSRVGLAETGMVPPHRSIGQSDRLPPVVSADQEDPAAGNPDEFCAGVPLGRPNGPV